MSSNKAKSKATPVNTDDQGAVTAPPPRCPLTGRPLDQWGLPLNGPARIAALAELAMPDPNDEPDAWASRQAVETASLSSTLPPQDDTAGEDTPSLTEALKLGEEE